MRHAGPHLQPLSPGRRPGERGSRGGGRLSYTAPSRQQWLAGNAAPEEALVRRPFALLVLVIALAAAAALLLAVRGQLRPRLQPAATLPTATAPPTAAPPQLSPTASQAGTTAMSTPSPAALPTTPAPATARAAPPTAPAVATASPSNLAPTVSTPTAATATASYSYPIGAPGRPLGDGFFIRHGAQVENTWYAPGNWHTGEDWYALEGDTGGAQVYAVAAGEVVYAGANYPGRVVIVAHPDGLYAMYGHLDPALAVGVGTQVVRGQLLGSVLAQRGARAPSHLHFELRTFLTAREVNGGAPRYGYRCGVDCPPGPGYWPIDAPDLPGDQGWRHPTHVIARRMFGAAPGEQLGAVVAASAPVSPSLTLWSAPPDDPGRQPLKELAPQGGERLPLLAVWAGEEAPRQTSALAYRLWYRVRLPDGQEGWVQAAVPSAGDTGADGRPSGVAFSFFPAVDPAQPAPSGGS